MSLFTHLVSAGRRAECGRDSHSTSDSFTPSIIHASADVRSPVSIVSSILIIRIHFHTCLQRGAPFAMLTTASLQTRRRLQFKCPTFLIISSSLSLSAASTSASSSSVGGLVSRGCPLPPEIPGGQYQILPVRRNFSSASVSPISSRFLNLMNFSSLSVPIYSSALYSCHRGFLSGGSSLISCSPGGWWQPTHNAPRCVPYGSSAASSSSSSSASGTHHQHNSHGTSPPPPSPPPWFLSSSPGGGLVVDERVTGRLMGVRCPQFPRQHRRWTIDCGFDLEAGSSDVANSSNRTRPLPILCWPAVLFIASARI